MESLVVALIILVVVAVAFLIGREIVCWYWKINEMNQLLGELLQEQRKTNRILKNEPEPSPVAESVATE